MKHMNVLGVTFDCKLTWSVHVAKTLTKARKALFGLRSIKKYFTPIEMRNLLDSNFYSILYYNACIWLTPDLHSELKQNLLSLSANALRSCVTYHSSDVSFKNIHVKIRKVPPSN